MKLSKWAKLHNISYQSAWNQFKKGQIPGAYQLSSGTIVVPEDEHNRPEYVVAYVRSMDKEEVKLQKSEIEQYAKEHNIKIKKIVVESGSALNECRTGLMSILENKNVTKIIVTSKDRISRFGFEYIKALFNGSIIILNEYYEDPKELKDDIGIIVNAHIKRAYSEEVAMKVKEILKGGG